MARQDWLSVDRIAAAVAAPVATVACTARLLSKCWRVISTEQSSPAPAPRAQKSKRGGKTRSSATSQPSLEVDAAPV